MKRTLFLFMILCGAISCTKEKPQEPQAETPAPEKATVLVEIPSNLIASETVTLSQMSLLGAVKDFENGLVTDENHVVEVEVEPFKVEDGGFTVTFKTSDGRVITSDVMTGPDDGDFEVGPGECLDIYVPSADPFLPCRFPVVFPLGKNPNARTGYYNYWDDQPNWSNMGVWRCFDQKQVYATWNKVSDPSPNYRQKRELLNTGEIGTIGLKGIWTGDYFEFVFPVKDIAAGSTVSFKAPFYGRQQPVFWTVKWLEDGEWKSSLSDVTTWDGSVTLKASFATRLHGVVIEHSFTLGKAIEKGYLKVRIECTDGRYQAATETNTVVQRSLPFNNGTEYFSPFYFYCQNSGVNSFTWNITNN